MHLPLNIKFEKVRARLEFTLAGLPFGSLCCIVLPSRVSSSRSPFSKCRSLLSRHLTWSLVLETLLGFWRRRIGNTTVALRATDSSAEADPNAWYNRASSLTNSLPTLPVGTEKQLRLQCITSIYVLSNSLVKTAPSRLAHVNMDWLRLGYPGSERACWSASVASLTNDIVSLAGNCLRAVSGIEAVVVGTNSESMCS